MPSASNAADRLFDQAQRRHREGDATPFGAGARDDVCGQQGLAEARGGLDHRAHMAGHHRSPSRDQRAFLLGVKRAERGVHAGSSVKRVGCPLLRTCAGHGVALPVSLGSLRIGLT